MSKKEALTLSSGLKTLARKLKTSWKIDTFRDAYTLEKLKQARVFVIVCPTEKLSVNDVDALRKYLEQGGSVLVMLQEDGEKKYGININFFLEEYGIVVNSGTPTTLRTLRNRSTRRLSAVLRPKIYFTDCA